MCFTWRKTTNVHKNAPKIIKKWIEKCLNLTFLLHFQCCFTLILAVSFFTPPHICVWTNWSSYIVMALSWWLHTSIWYLCLSLCSGVQVNSPYLEEHLMHMIKQDQSKVHNMDLLWRYYEKNRNFGKAAHVLARLADMHRFGHSSTMPTPQHATHLHGKLATSNTDSFSKCIRYIQLIKKQFRKSTLMFALWSCSTEISLKQRLEYIARAILSAKSSSSISAQASDGEFLHELEEKMEVTLTL